MFRYKETYTFPFSAKIPSYLNEYKLQYSKIKSYSKFIKRYLILLFLKQKKYELKHLPISTKKILWINLSAPSIGDSLMDLSSRVMLKSFNLDLFTSRKNSNVYENDKFFNNIYTDYSAAKANNYDLIIIDSFSSRSIRAKFNIAPKALFVSMFGFFNGPEVNRVLFSFNRMNKLLGEKYSEKEINSFAKPCIYADNKNICLPNMEFISIVIGGEWEYRTYKNWKKVIKYILNNYKSTEIALIGSINGKSEASKLVKYFPSRVKSFVGEYSFNQTAEIIRNSKILICCDGGLMHCGNCFKKILVPLFAKLSPEMQLTESITAFSCFDKTDVNNIKPQKIMAKVKLAIDYADKYLQS